MYLNIPLDQGVHQVLPTHTPHLKALHSAGIIRSLERQLQGTLCQSVKSLVVTRAAVLYQVTYIATCISRYTGIHFL